MDVPLRSIDLSQLSAGTQLLLETTESVWTLMIVDPEAFIVRVEGTDRRFLGLPKQGQFLKSFSRDSRDAGKLGLVIEDHCFSIRFADAVFVSEPVISARVEGVDWHYDVF